MPPNKARATSKKGRTNAGKSSGVALEPRRGFGGGSRVPKPIGGSGGGGKKQAATKVRTERRTDNSAEETATTIDQELSGNESGNDTGRDDDSSQTESSSRRSSGASSMNVVHDEVTEGSNSNGRKRHLEDYDGMANGSGDSAVKAYRRNLMSSGTGAVWSVDDIINVTTAKTKEEVFPIIKFFDASGNKDARTEKEINSFIQTRIPSINCDKLYKKIRTEIARTLRVRRSSVVHAAGIRIRGSSLSKCVLGLGGFTLSFVLIFFC